MLVDKGLVKRYLRLDEECTDEDNLIELMIDNAEIYIKDSGTSLDENNQDKMKKARLLALILITDFYENRDLTGKASEKIRDIVQLMLTQLKYC